KEPVKGFRYQCQGCKFMKANEKTHLPITCDLCPVPGGALKPLVWRNMTKRKKKGQSTSSKKKRKAADPKAKQKLASPLSSGIVMNSDAEDALMDRVSSQSQSSASSSVPPEAEDGEMVPPPDIERRQSNRSVSEIARRDDFVWIPQKAGAVGCKPVPKQKPAETEKEDAAAAPAEGGAAAEEEEEKKEEDKIKAWWGHSCCAKWTPELFFSDDLGSIDATNIAMATQKRKTKLFLIRDKKACVICGSTDYMKTGCDTKRCDNFMHVGCARQSGFEVSTAIDDELPDEEEHILQCYTHTDEEFALKGRIASLLDVMGGANVTDVNCANGQQKASRALFRAARVVSILAWAWRWGDWWVAGPSSPDAKKKSNPSLVERKLDARDCRLAALSAALRNRDYDREVGLEKEVLEAGLKAVISTSSICGELTKAQVR
ncbi:hypothetical protein TeGR_g2277, partial [Tetraparma gracilis]